VSGQSGEPVNVTQHQDGLLWFLGEGKDEILSCGLRGCDCTEDCVLYLSTTLLINLPENGMDSRNSYLISVQSENLHLQ